MIIKKLSTLVILTSILSVCLSETSSQDLAQINSKISKVKSNLSKNTLSRKQLQVKLKALDLENAKLSKSIQLNRQKSNAKQASLKDLKDQQKQLQKKLIAQKDTLNQELVSAYVTSRQPYVKLLLEQRNPQELNRLSNYYHYLYEYQSGLITSLEETIRNIDQNKQQITHQQKQLSAIISQQIKQKSQLSSTKRDRESVIHSYNKKIKQQHQALEVLNQNKKTLDKTLAKLNSHPRPSGQVTFAQQKGALVWPTNGEVTHRFGTKIQQSELTWSGVVLRAPAGQTVRSVADGDVIFAKWLSGYGMLVIINHGDGYMSLYGRNQTLYVKQGSRVKAGQKIATVGQTGGFDQPGLYFAIRHNAKPLNPKLWCSKKPSQGRQS